MTCGLERIKEKYDLLLFWGMSITDMSIMLNVSELFDLISKIWIVQSLTHKLSFGWRKKLKTKTKHVG